MCVCVYIRNLIVQQNMMFHHRKKGEEDVEVYDVKKENEEKKIGNLIIR